MLAPPENSKNVIKRLLWVARLSTSASRSLLERRCEIGEISQVSLNL